MSWRVALAAGLLAAGLASAQPGTGRRYALIVGENRGLSSDEALRFAEDDARRVRDVLTELGGVAPSDAWVLTGTSVNAGSVREALATVSAALRSAGDGGASRLIVYVSSHAGEGEFHFNGTTLPFADLVEFVKQAPVEVGVLVVDACRSGAVTRLKGLKPSSAPTVTVESGLKGRVFISASGADEYAQESDLLQGSAFTHHLVAGLRGAADASHDGAVTVDEAYAWAWARTLESTFGSTTGLQRPQVHVDLRGEGELVLTQPGQATARLTLGVESAGHWLVVDRKTQRLVADLVKPGGPVSLALPPGSYAVRLRTDRQVFERTVTVPEAGTVVVKDAELEQASLQRVALKGGAPVELALSAGGVVASGLVAGLQAQPGVDVRLRRDGHLVSFLNQLSAEVSWRTGASPNAGFAQNEVQVAFGAGHRFQLAAPWGAARSASLALGLAAGALFVHQSQLPDGSSRNSLGPSLQFDVEGRLPLGGPLELSALGSAGGAVMKKSTGINALPRLSAALALVVVW